MIEGVDLFCGEGGASVGYARAGIRMRRGVDLKPRSRYPFPFHQGDALAFPLDGFDFVHASPPCQHYSIATAGKGGRSRAKHPDLIASVRDRLIASGLPYVIENVPLAPLRDPLILCGTMFDLVTQDVDGAPLFLRRHRLFESNISLTAPRPCRCREWKVKGWNIGGVYGGARGAVNAGQEGRDEARLVRKGGYTPRIEQRRALMGIDWMTLEALDQAIPPAYTEWIGRQILAAIA